MPTDTILKLTGITKAFSGVEVLHGIDFEVARGEIHALVGENGAGKSTLVKILSGVYPHGEYEGDISLTGQKVRFKGIADAEKAGIEIISQELELVPQLPVYENVFLGAPILRNHLIDRYSMIQKSEEIFRKLGVSIDSSALVEQLGVGHQQMVAIAKALRTEAGILILDEPTAALSDSEAEILFSVLRELKQKGITIIYISHRLKEVLTLSDRVTVLRDGKTITTQLTSNLDEKTLVRFMIGRELAEQFPARKSRIGEVIFEVKDFSAYDEQGKEVVHDINFEVRKGEILGIAGLVGAGRSELVRAVFGAMNRKGETILEGKPLKITSPLSAIRAGIGLVSEDRKRDGFVPMLSIEDNVTLANLKELSSSGVIRENDCIRAAEEFRDNLRIKSRDIYQPVEKLSGGNQQKVCIAKFLMTSPKVLILDEPTRGVDVGAKYEIYVLLNQLVDQGIAVIIVSSELPELLGMTDRIMVMSFGRERAILNTNEATQEIIMQYATAEGA